MVAFCLINGPFIHFNSLQGRVVLLCGGSGTQTLYIGGVGFSLGECFEAWFSPEFDEFLVLIPLATSVLILKIFGILELLRWKIDV